MSTEIWFLLGLSHIRGCWEAAEYKRRGSFALVWAVCFSLLSAVQPLQLSVCGSWRVGELFLFTIVLCFVARCLIKEH